MQKFKKGQKVRVTKKLNGHYFEIGEIVEIIESNQSANNCSGDYYCSNGNGYWYLTDDELEAID